MNEPNLIEFNCLQIGDADCTGNKFNGHDLHLNLQKRNINAVHLVYNKLSDDETTFILKGADNFSLSLINNNYFAYADIVHLHLMHNTPFDLNYLAIITKLKPTVITLHDPFYVGGHCIHHHDCEKWKEHCFDCEYLDLPFILAYDLTSLNFEIKKDAIQRSQIQAIISSKWMKNKILASPVWHGKKVHQVQFGIDQNIFKPVNLSSAKENLEIKSDKLVLFARTQVFFKGLNILKEAFSQLAARQDFVLLTVGQNGLLDELPENIEHKEFGWISDDKKLVELYQACDLFLMPSELEAFGLMAVEAMSCGKMVLALETPYSAVPEVIDAPNCGVAVAKDLYAAELMRLVQEPQEIINRGQRSLDYARRQYGLEVYLQKITDVYKKVMDDFIPSENTEFIVGQLQKHSKKLEHVELEHSKKLEHVELEHSKKLEHVELEHSEKVEQVNEVKCCKKNVACLMQGYRRLLCYYRQHGFLRTLKKIKEKTLKKL